MNMLFLEDDVIIRDGYRNYLKNYFSEIYETSSAEDALDIIGTKDIDFMIVDINLEEMDGLTFIKKIREKNLTCQIAILSAYDNKDFLIKAIPLNLVTYMVKPVKKEEFIKTIETVISRNTILNSITLENDYIWDKSLKRLTCDKKIIKLTKNEYILFEHFCNKEQLKFSLEDAFNEIYPNDFYNENKIRMIIKRLRQKTFNEIIVNDYNLGYKFNYKLS